MHLKIVIIPNTYIIYFLDSVHIPFSGRNPKFRETLSGRPSVLILNKVDLIDGTNQRVNAD
jgi:ribosome biogenesis GTPase A